MRLTLYTDGACKGNPGESGAGAVLINEETGETVDSLSKYTGVGTSNVSEYKALLLGLKMAAKYNPTVLVIRADSMLMVRQIRCSWKINEKHIAKLHRQAHKLLKEFQFFEIMHIPRKFNAAADKLANKGVYDERRKRMAR